MKQKTCDIILCCKGHGQGETAKECILNYQKERSGVCNLQLDDYEFANLLYNVCSDFLKGASDFSKESFLYDLFHGHSLYFIENIIFALSNIDVKSSENTYINGFTKEQIDIFLGTCKEKMYNYHNGGLYDYKK